MTKKTVPYIFKTSEGRSKAFPQLSGTPSAIAEKRDGLWDIFKYKVY